MRVEKTAPMIDDDLLRLRVDGWCLLQGVIPETELEDVRESVLTTVTSPEYLEDRDFLAHNSAFVRHVAEPRILAILEALWGPFHRVGWTGPTFRHPGDVREQWHVDWPFGRRPAAGILPPFPDAVMYLTSIWMLSPFLPDSGGTIIAPGTHRSGIDPTTDAMIDEKAPRSTEMRVSGERGASYCSTAGYGTPMRTTTAHNRGRRCGCATRRGGSTCSRSTPSRPRASGWPRSSETPQHRPCRAFLQRPTTPCPSRSNLCTTIGSIGRSDVG